MRIARVLITRQCPRRCDVCCNRDERVMSQIRPCTVADLQSYDQVLITGGEPMLYPARLLEIVQQLRAQTFQASQKIYLYTTIYKDWLKTLISLIDGIHYTLHYPLRPGDLEMFYDFQNFQRWVGDLPRSFRLYIDPRISQTIGILPCLWARVEVKPWLTDMVLPEHEELFDFVDSKP